MPGRKDAAKPDEAAVQASAPATPPALERDKLTDKQLAKAVLAGEFKPRAAELRRLAEAVLKKSTPKAKKAKGKKAKSGKLAKIPQKRK